MVLIEGLLVATRLYVQGVLTMAHMHNKQCYVGIV